MVNYIIRRLLIGLVTLIFITLLVYGLIRNMPGDPTTLDLGESNPDKTPSKEEVARSRASYGLDKSWPEGYLLWVSNIAQGDLDYSRQQKETVAKLIWRHLGPTLQLSIPSLLISFMLAVPLGLYSTARNGTFDERATSTFLYMLYSIPSFVLALLLLIVFYVHLSKTVFHLPIGITSNGFNEMSFLGQVGDLVWHMILPVFCLTYANLAYYSRFVKANMEEVIRQDYIRTARAKGVHPWNILIFHAFRNSLIPFVTMLGLTLPALVSGAIILEQIFVWPGMGTLFIESLHYRDYVTIMGETLLFSVLTLLGQLVADLLYAFVDPRIVYS